ncbi:GNAT family N-acetyltransferase [Patescibacteria group bacterium]|nr:GNAT family N-acetyltransferase [Patescibacteria group bacterium]
MNIARAKIKDLKDVVELSYKSAMYHKKLTPYYDTSKDVKEVLTKSLKKNIYSSNSCIFIAEENNKIIGYLLAFKVNRLEMFKVKKAGLIADVFIKEDYRRKGIGDKLIKECFDWFRGDKISFAEINVEVSNKQAINFWNKKGFKDVSIERYKRI